MKKYISIILITLLTVSYSIPVFAEEMQSSNVTQIQCNGLCTSVGITLNLSSDLIPLDV